MIEQRRRIVDNRQRSAEVGIGPEAAAPERYRIDARTVGGLDIVRVSPISILPSGRTRDFANAASTMSGSGFDSVASSFDVRCGNRSSRRA